MRIMRPITIPGATGTPLRILVYPFNTHAGGLPRPSEATPWSIRDGSELCRQAGQRRFAYSVAEENREGRAKQKERLPNQTCTRCVVARPLLNYQYSHYHSANNVNYALPKVDYLCRSPSVTLRLKLIL